VVQVQSFCAVVRSASRETRQARGFESLPSIYDRWWQAFTWWQFWRDL